MKYALTFCPERNNHCTCNFHFEIKKGHIITKAWKIGKPKSCVINTTILRHTRPPLGKLQGKKNNNKKNNLLLLDSRRDILLVLRPSCIIFRPFNFTVAHHYTTLSVLTLAYVQDSFIRRQKSTWEAKKYAASVPLPFHPMSSQAES